MEYKNKYTKEQAIENAKKFLEEVTLLEEKYSISFNSDKGDIYLSYQTSKKDKVWDFVNIGWTGDGTGLTVTEKTKDVKKEEALSKLTDEDKELLGLK